MTNEEKTYYYLKTVVLEPKESEDEKVRKELIECIETLIKAPGASPRLCDWLAYLEKQKEQQSAEWSKKDEKMRNKIIEHLSGFIYPNSLYGEDAKECINWLKSLRPQPKQEWSEEDEIEHDYLCKLLRETWDKVDKGSCIDDAITWFEKLPERIFPHSWKPSEEQVSILGKVFARCELNTSERDSMVDLFYHLKDMI